jgi:DNA-directed RNA polymerase specialized sigma24 family protein
MENDKSDSYIDIDEDIDEDINEDIDEIIVKAVNGDKTSLGELMVSPWLAGILKEITTQKARQFRIDHNEIRDRICDQLRENITTIENPKKESIRAWCKSTATYFCFNGSRHRKVEDRYVDQVIHENIHGTRKSAKGTIIVLQSPATISPEDVMLQAEEDLLWASRKADVYSQVRNAVMALPPEDIKITLLWARGMRLKEIAQETGTPLATVQRHLKKSQKQILESVGIQNLIAGDTELTKGAYELVANCMLEMNSRGYFPQRAA